MRRPTTEGRSGRRIDFPIGCGGEGERSTCLVEPLGNPCIATPSPDPPLVVGDPERGHGGAHLAGESKGRLRRGTRSAGGGCSGAPPRPPKQWFHVEGNARGSERNLSGREKSLGLNRGANCSWFKCRSLTPGDRLLFQPSGSGSLEGGNRGLNGKPKHFYFSRHSTLKRPPPPTTVGSP